MINKVILVGRLGKDPELRYTQSGVPVTTLVLATSESYIDKSGARQEKTEWHNVVFFQKQAELCSQYLVKGSLIYVEGSLHTRSWEDQQGQKRYTVEVRGMRVQFLDRVEKRNTEAPLADPDEHFTTFPSSASDIDDIPF